MCQPLGQTCSDSAQCCDGKQCTSGRCGGCLIRGEGCSSGSLPCCGDGTCTSGYCVATYCTRSNEPCSAAKPCCGDTPICNPLGQCVTPHPTCMPDGGLCSAAHPCCSGKPCCNGVCGSLCVSAGGNCDADHPCCRGEGGTCTNGKCVPSCLVTNAECSTASGPACCNGNCRFNYNRCFYPGASGVGESCSPDYACAPWLACIAGICREIVGCLIEGTPCSPLGRTTSCCSGLCRDDGSSKVGGTCSP